MSDEGGGFFDGGWHRIGDFLQVGSLCERHGFAAMASHPCPCPSVTFVYEHRRADLQT